MMKPYVLAAVFSLSLALVPEPASANFVCAQNLRSFLAPKPVEASLLKLGLENANQKAFPEMRITLSNYERSLISLDNKYQLGLFANEEQISRLREALARMNLVQRWALDVLVGDLTTKQWPYIGGYSPAMKSSLLPVLESLVKGRPNLLKGMQGSGEGALFGAVACPAAVVLTSIVEALFAIDYHLGVPENLNPETQLSLMLMSSAVCTVGGGVIGGAAGLKKSAHFVAGDLRTIEDRTLKALSIFAHSPDSGMSDTHVISEIAAKLGNDYHLPLKTWRIWSDHIHTALKKPGPINEQSLLAYMPYRPSWGAFVRDFESVLKVVGRTNTTITLVLENYLASTGFVNLSRGESQRVLEVLLISMRISPVDRNEIRASIVTKSFGTTD